ncbi:hypothetical protein PR048_011955 [Dryococelus australis]|uniref:HTH CENPB-type domain-containing protein n=1 Tax=Dryococelus australis TaxID=614101 RepID=A0ABQ9HNA1_9NEOP|nr:hypothetical protein PR048_011955 [Dryococelus australis]
MLAFPGPMLIEQAKNIFCAELKLSYDWDFSLGWLRKFKKMQRRFFLKLIEEKLLADTEVGEKFIVEFGEYMLDNNLTAEQVYNADETALYWRCMPQSTLFTVVILAVGLLDDYDLDSHYTQLRPHFLAAHTGTDMSAILNL